MIGKLNSKKSQLIIFSACFLFFLLIFIYHLETNNTYITKSSEVYIVENIIDQVCFFAKNTNSSAYYSYLEKMEDKTENFCIKEGFFCDLKILNLKNLPPTNNDWSSIDNLNDYSYFINFSFNNFLYESNFNCVK